MAGKLLTTLEVAERLRTSPETVRYWRHVGRGPKGFKVGRRVLYEESAVTAWIEECRAAELLTHEPKVSR